MPGQCGSDLDSTTDCVTLASHGISLSLSFPTCKQNMLTALPWLGSGKITDTNASHNSKRSHFHTQSSPICILTLVTSSSLPSPAPSWPQLMKLSPLQGSSLESLGVFSFGVPNHVMGPGVHPLTAGKCHSYPAWSLFYLCPNSSSQSPVISVYVPPVPSIEESHLPHVENLSAVTRAGTRWLTRPLANFLILKTRTACTG